MKNLKDSLEEKTLYPKKWKSMLFLLLTLAFTVAGVWIILDGEKMGWFVSIFFGLGVLVFLINLFPQASYLKLNEEVYRATKWSCSISQKNIKREKEQEKYLRLLQVQKEDFMILSD